MESFYCKTKIIAGAGAVSALEEFKAKRVLVVTDPFFYQNGMAEQVAHKTKATHYEIFHQVKPDPSVELAACGTARVKEFGPDLMVALGGGSAMDCAKAMRFFSGLDIPLAAIPTTSGSGSEVTDFAILPHNGVKNPLVDARLRPELAVLDSDFLKELPASLVADGGFDAISHALEALVAKNAGAVTNALATDAFCTVFARLPASYAGDPEARLAVHKAATMAGMAFTQAGLGMCHALSHALGGMFHIPHGRLNAILLPAVIGCNAYTCGDRYAALARTAGLGGSADTIGVRNLKNGLIRLRRQLGIPETLAQAGVAPRKLRGSMDKIVEAALADPCCQTNPAKVEAFMVRRCLEEVVGRG